MYTNRFSNYLKKQKPLVKRLVDILGRTYDYVSCLATDVQGTNIRVNKAVTNVNPSNITESGYVVRVYNHTIYVEYSFHELNEHNIEELIQKIKLAADQSIQEETVSTKVLEEEPLIKDFIRKNEGKDFEISEIIPLLKHKVEEYLAQKEELVNVNISVECNEISKLFISKKKELTQYYPWTNINCYAISKKGSLFKDAYSGEGYPSLEEGINRLDKIVDYATNVAIELLDATTPEPGIYTIITNPSITGLIAHEAFGHGVEMDMFVRDRAKAKEYMNKYVASPFITMHDGAASVLSAASYFFDDDGVLAKDTVIIDKGILKQGISDALSALELGTVPTGNGRRESYKRKSYTRMTNTFFEKGNTTLEEMIQSVDEGYMIFDTNNGMEDPKNWGIQCTALYGREIKHGKFTGKIVSPIVMSGYVIDLLTSISMVSTDVIVTGSGSCGKGYKEWVRVSDGGACLKARVKIG